MYKTAEKKKFSKNPSFPDNPAVPLLMGPVAFRPHLAIGLAFYCLKLECSVHKIKSN